MPLTLNQRCFQAFLIVSGLLAATSCSSVSGSVQKQLKAGSGKVQLPGGVIELDSPLEVPASASKMEIVGVEGTTLRASGKFQGRALLHVTGGSNVTIRNLIFDGNRAAVGRPVDLPGASSPLSGYFQNHGILVTDASNVLIENVRMREIAGFAVAASATKGIKIVNLSVDDSGGRGIKGKNNTTGGVLLEEGTDDFEVRDSKFKKVLGNGVWTHSTYLSPRNYRGLIINNSFETIGRDAIQVGHANRVRVEANFGRFIGYPFDAIDMEAQAVPVAVDTAGKVDEGVYTKNRFEDINGKCFDLDGFHDGEVSENTCINNGAADDYPNGGYALVMNNTFQEMQSQLITIRDNVFDGSKFGAVFVIGAGHKIVNNKFLNLNKAGCNESNEKFNCTYSRSDPEMLQAGIYLGMRAERVDPARETTIEGNTITGHMMASRCIGRSPTLPGAGIVLSKNTCTDVR